jgi:Flp pilus assembly protein TadG
MAAVAALPLIIGIGAAIDYTKVSSDVQQAQNAVDNAVLAASKQFYEDYRRRTLVKEGRKYVNLNLDDIYASENYKTKTRLVRVSDDEFEIRSQISGTTPHSFMGIIGKPSTSWTVDAVTSVSSPSKIEIMVVLDISDSMRKVKKLSRMKTASKSFITDISPYKQGNAHLTVSLIPFGGSVNLGKNADIWLDETKGLKKSDKFYGCFRYLNNTTEYPGDLQAYQQGIIRPRKRPLCPSDNSKVLLFSQDQQELINHINKMDMSWGTASPQALMWANRFLENSWRRKATHFADNRPIKIDTKTQKYVVFLTDGAVAMVDGNQDGKTDKLIGDNAAINMFKAQCSEIKKLSNTHVYMIGYNVPNGKFKNAMKTCTAGDGQYFDAKIDNLTAIFSQISNEFQNIRIIN